MAMRFLVWLVRTRAIQPDTARNYLSEVQGWHAREFGVKLAGGLKLERVPQLIKGLRRSMPGKAKQIRRGISPKQLRRAFDRCLDPANPLHANLRAALACALQGLLRSAEFCGKRSAETLLRGDVQELDASKLVLMMHVCKKQSAGEIAGKTHPLVIGAGGGHVDAVAEVANLRRVDPAADGAPLFRDPATNEPLSYEYVLKIVRWLMEAIGEEPAHFFN